MSKMKLALLVTGFVVLALTGCATSATASGTPSSSPTDGAAPLTPSASPTATAAEPAPAPPADLRALVVSATQLTLLDANGDQEATFVFNDEDPAPFVEALSASVSAAPTETTKPGGFEGAQFTTTYEWVGLEMSTFYSPGQCSPDCRGAALVVTAAQLEGIPIRTVSGIRVGDTVAAARERGARPTSDIPLAAEPEDPALFDSTTESTRIVLLDLPDSDHSDDNTQIIRIRASGWFTTFGNI